MAKKKLNQPWTAEDDATIREFGPKISLQRLAVRLKRSGPSVVNRARELGVTVKKKTVMRAEVRGTSGTAADEA